MEYIIFFIPNLGKGGAERILVNIANSIVQDYGDKYRVIIALSQKEGYYLDYVNEIIDVVDLHSKHVSQSIFSLARLLRGMRKEKLHLFSFLGYANIVAILASYLSLFRKRIDLIVSERNHIPWNNDFKSHLVYLFQKLLYKKCDSIITIGDSISKEIENKLGVSKAKIYTIYNPLTIGEIRDIPDGLFKKEETNIITAGRMIPVKDFSLLLRAFALISREKPSRLWILGEGPEKESLLREAESLAIKDRVMMPGFVDSPISYFKKADVYVCSSQSEGFANVVLEAMAAGTRIVSMSCGGPDEILENGKWGEIVYDREPQKLANAIMQILGRNKCDYSERLIFFEKNRIVEQYVSVLKTH